MVGGEGDSATLATVSFVSPPTTKSAATDTVVLALATALEQGEREIIRRPLESMKNNKTQAAILGTTPRPFHRRARCWRCGAAEAAGS